MLKRQDTRRLTGLIPLLCTVWTFMLYLKEGRPDELLWICNVSNLVLGISILLSWAPGIWASTLWVLIGTPLWVLDAMNTSGFEIHSFFTHIGGSVIGLLACRSHAPQGKIWWKAFALLIACQVLARALTRPAYNVNVVFTPYGTQMPYPLYWLCSAAAFNLALFATEWALLRLLTPTIQKPHS